MQIPSVATVGQNLTSHLSLGEESVCMPSTTRHAQTLNTDDLALAYKRASPEQKKLIRIAQLITFIANDLRVSKATAKSIVGMTRTMRSEQEQESYWRAKAYFRYHVQRPPEKHVVDEKETVEASVAACISVLRRISVNLGRKKSLQLCDELQSLIRRYERR